MSNNNLTEPKTTDFKWERPDIDIEVPGNYLALVTKAMCTYSDWLTENNQLQEKADKAETEEEQELHQKACTAHFKKRYSGVIAKDQGDRLSPSKMIRIWETFITNHYRDFMKNHVNLTMEQILQVGIDKFIYTMGWSKASDTGKWRNNKVRVGLCCHCKDQFIPLIFQHNHGLCMNCRPTFSVTAIRNFLLHQMDISSRYQDAQYDLLMDFYIIFYHDEKLRNLFLKGSESAKKYENIKISIPEQNSKIEEVKE